MESVPSHCRSADVRRDVSGRKSHTPMDRAELTMTAPTMTTLCLIAEDAHTSTDVACGAIAQLDIHPPHTMHK